MIYSLKVINSAFCEFLEERPQKEFLDYLTLKSVGYSKRYVKPIMPLNQADYFSPIYILYKNIFGQVVPIMTQRYVSKRTCLGLNLMFPIEEMVLDSQCKESIDKYYDFVKGPDKDGRDLIYPGSFTTNPSFSYSLEEKKLFVELTCAFHYAEVLRSPGSSFVTTSVKKFKTYRVLENAGHKLLNGMKGFRKESFYGEEVLLMGTHYLSSLCKESFNKYEGLFNEDHAKKLAS